MVGFAKARKLPLELLHLRAEDEVSRIENAPVGGVQLLAHRRQRRMQLEERDFHASRATSAPDRAAHRSGPGGNVEAVVPEECQRDPLHAETDAGAVRGLAVCVDQVPGPAEMILVVVEAEAGGGLRAGDRDQQLEFEALLALALGENYPGAPEEGIVGHLDL